MFPNKRSHSQAEQSQSSETPFNNLSDIFFENQAQNSDNDNSKSNSHTKPKQKADSQPKLFSQGSQQAHPGSDSQHQTNNICKQDLKKLNRKTLKSINFALSRPKFNPQDIANIFSLKLDTVNRLQAYYKRSGSIENFCERERAENSRRSLPREMCRPPKLTLMLERLVNICKNNPKLKQVEIRDVIERRFGVDLSQASVSRYIGVVNTVFNELRNKSRSESEDKKQPLGEDSPADQP